MVSWYPFCCFRAIYGWCWFVIFGDSNPNNNAFEGFLVPNIVIVLLAFPNYSKTNFRMVIYSNLVRPMNLLHFQVYTYIYWLYSYGYNVYTFRSTISNITSAQTLFLHRTWYCYNSRPFSQLMFSFSFFLFMIGSSGRPYCQQHDRIPSGLSTQRAQGRGRRTERKAAQEKGHPRHQGALLPHKRYSYFYPTDHFAILESQKTFLWLVDYVFIDSYPTGFIEATFSSLNSRERRGEEFMIIFRLIPTGFFKQLFRNIIREKGQQTLNWW